MKWFDKSIPEAIQTSKQQKVVFIVYISGQDELSQKMRQTWEDDKVKSACDSGGCVAIKIEANSDECRFFSQIYPVVLVPSTFFIGENGVPLEVVGGFVEGSELARKIESVIQTHKTQLQAAASGAPPMQSATGNTVSTSDEAQIPELQRNENETEADFNIRLEKAKILLEQKRQEKVKKAEEEERGKEVERRKLGQDLQKLKHLQQDQQAKEIKEQLKKDKEDERKAKERVREQIARDREDRAAKYKKEKQEQVSAKQEADRAKQGAKQQAVAEAEAKRSEFARIQVRLPDGSAMTQQFSATDTLQTVHDFVAQRTNSPLSFSTTFPKRTFTDADLSSTLVDLLLVPSAVLIAVPVRRSAVSPSSISSGSGIFSLLFAPFIMVWNFIYSLFFGGGSGGQSDDPPQGAQSSPQTSTDRDTDVPMETRSRPNRPKTGYMRRAPGNQPEAGRVRRMADVRDDDDDDMATWNGNSTQQM